MNTLQFDYEDFSLYDTDEVIPYVLLDGEQPDCRGAAIVQLSKDSASEVL